MNMTQSNRMLEGYKMGNRMAKLDKKEAGKIVFFRILIMVLVCAAVGIFFNSLIHSTAVNAAGFTAEYTFAVKVLPVLRIVFAALIVLSAAYLVYTIVKKVDTSTHIVTPYMLFAVFMYLGVFAGFYNRFRETPFLFWTLTVVLAVFFAVYYLYTVLMYKK